MSAESTESTVVAAPEVGPRNHFVDEAQRFAFSSRDLAPGEDDSKCGLQTDLPRQAMQSAAQRNGTHQQLRQAEQLPNRLAITRSQASTISSPPPNATPLTAAMMGLAEIKAFGDSAIAGSRIGVLARADAPDSEVAAEQIASRAGTPVLPGTW